jgi:dTDP-4-dehydrorhamnose 3,5-epimerase
VVIVEPEMHRDDRGYFMETYQKQQFAQAGLPDDFVQDNHSHSRHKVLRGIHLQDRSAPMGKLVRCTLGSILDVAVDLRVGSPTFGKWVGVELSQENLRELMVPAGFGHAFVTLSDWADVQYKCTGYYTQVAERTIAWNDPEIGIDWPIPDPIVSAKDTRGMSLREYAKNPAFEYEQPGLRQKP